MPALKVTEYQVQPGDIGANESTVAQNSATGAHTSVAVDGKVVEKQPNLLDPAPTFIIVAINLLILYFVLKKLLFGKFTAFLEKRRLSIETALEESQKAKEFAEKTRQEYADKIKNAQAEIEKMLEEARQNASKQTEEIIKAAKDDATGMMEKAKAEIEKEKDKMIKEVRSDVATLALAAASKVIEANLNTEANKKLVEKFIDEAGVA